LHFHDVVDFKRLVFHFTPLELVDPLPNPCGVLPVLVIVPPFAVSASDAV
jgi:hypothetical protein